MTILLTINLFLAIGVLLTYFLQQSDVKVHEHNVYTEQEDPPKPVKLTGMDHLNRFAKGKKVTRTMMLKEMYRMKRINNNIQKQIRKTV
jgi:hypothetical protein